MKTTLAYRMRPKSLNDILGQEHLIGEGKLLKQFIKKNICWIF